MRFETEAQRMNEPQACLIPASILHSLLGQFPLDISDAVLELMRTDSIHLTHQVQTLMHQLDCPLKKRFAWIAMALSHNELSDKALQEFAHQLGISGSLLQAAAELGKPNFLEVLITDKNARLDILNYFKACNSAAKCGHIPILERLIVLAPDHVQGMIEDDDYSVFRLAAQNGHLLVLERLIELAPDRVQAMIQADNYFSFRKAAQYGHLPVLERLIVLAPDRVQAMIEKYNYSAFRLAAENGRPLVLERLIELAPDHVQAMIKALDYSAFRLAAENGHLPILERLIELAPDRMQAMIQAGNYFAFRKAAENGHLPVLERLIELAPDRVRAMIKADNYGAFRETVQHGRLPVINYLLSFATQFAHAEMHEWEYEYAQYTHPFVREKIVALRTQKAAMEQDTPNRVFDIPADDAQLCFYMLRSLIRRNEPALSEEIGFFLEIPAVHNLAHAAGTTHETNELLRLALTRNNQTAATLLLAIPAVRELAAQHNYYHEERQDALDLRVLAGDIESSMLGLTPGEKKRLQAAITHYQPIIQTAGIPYIMEELRQTLRA